MYEQFSFRGKHSHIHGWKFYFLGFLSILCFGDTVDYYSPAMLGLKTDQEVLGELVKVKAPAVGQLMDQYPGIWTLVVSRWFICLYIDILPIEVRKSWVLLSNDEYECTIFTNIFVVSDGPAGLGLSFLRGLQGSFPRRPDSHHSPPAGDPQGSLSAWCVRVLQTDHLWRFHPGMSHFHAGATRNREQITWELGLNLYLKYRFYNKNDRQQREHLSRGRSLTEAHWDWNVMNRLIVWSV